MRISFTGISGVGKTTLIAKLQQHPLFKNYTTIDNVLRQLYGQDIPINDMGDQFDATQLLVMNKHLEYLLLNKNLLCGRCLLDGLCYTDYLWEEHKVCDWVKIYALELTSKYLSKYDYIFYLKPEFPLVNDGVRSLNKEFHNKVAEKFEQWASLFNKRDGNIITITGSIEERLQQIMFHLGD
jgi:thymidylate kinase